MYTIAEQTKFLKQYLQPQCRIGRLLLGCAIIASGFMAISSDGLSPALFLAFAAVGVFQIYTGVKPLLRFSDVLNQFRKNCEFLSVVEDFAEALPESDDKLRFGKHYLFAHSQGIIVPYCEIEKVYPFIRTINHIEVDRELRYQDLDEKEHTLCVLELEGKSDAQMHSIFRQLREKNDAIQIGYRP